VLSTGLAVLSTGLAVLSTGLDAQDAPNRTEYRDALGIALMAHWLIRAKCVLRGR
jgi:hypothetical protein